MEVQFMQNNATTRKFSGSVLLKAAALTLFIVSLTALAADTAISQTNQADPQVAGTSGGQIPDGSRPDLSTFTECDVCPTMVVIPSGEYTMGSPPDEELRGEDEGPQRKVAITRFALAKTELTFEQWDACVSEGGCSEDAASDRAWGRGNMPVMNISWNDAQDYVDWLNTIVIGALYRLPSEAEWEYAARAGTQTPFSVGDTISTDQANYNGNFAYGAGEEGVNRQKTVPVGDLDAANEWGLRHMHGNVWEWVEDCKHDSYHDAPSDGSPWLSSQNDECARRMVRGGGWSRPAWELRSAVRSEFGQSNRYFKVGFRPAKTLTP